MKLKDIGESNFIKRITGESIVNYTHVIRGPGDDTAVISPSDRVLLVTADLMAEDVHFIRDYTTGKDLGFKAMAVNLSDIAAMGGTPEHAFVSIAIPDTTELEYLDDIFEGMMQCGRAFDVNILGGDTTASRSGLVINVTVTGSAESGKILYRDAAKPGDIIFTTGYTGDSRAGLYCLQHEKNLQPEWMTSLVKAHLRPEPHVKEGQFLASQPGIHAAIDISDGLSSDLSHVLENSGVGCVIEGSSLPASGDLQQFCNTYSFDSAGYLLDGGEDYVLLCTMEPEYADSVAEEFHALFGRQLNRIGHITEEKTALLLHENAEKTPLRTGGWDHFRN